MALECLGVYMDGEVPVAESQVTVQSREGFTQLLELSQGKGREVWAANDQQTTIVHFSRAWL